MCKLNVYLILISFCSVSVSSFANSLLLDEIVEFSAFNLMKGEEELDLSKGSFETIKINVKTNEITYGGSNSDSLVTMESILDCGDEEWDCINAGSMSLSIRKNWNGNTKTWIHNDHVYEVLKFNYRNFHYNESDRGKNEINYYISSKSLDGEESYPNVFLYSKKEGIKAIIIYSQDFDESYEYIDGVYTRTYIKE